MGHKDGSKGAAGRGNRGRGRGRSGRGHRGNHRDAHPRQLAESAQDLAKGAQSSEDESDADNQEEDTPMTISMPLAMWVGAVHVFCVADSRTLINAIRNDARARNLNVWVWSRIYAWGKDFEVLSCRQKVPRQYLLQIVI